MKTFNEIFILDLHGNSLKKETTPEGDKDENVFDIMQGVSIALFIKNRVSLECEISHADLFGTREKKYQWLDEKAFLKDDYTAIHPESPWYFFIERNIKDIEHYNNWIKINEVFPTNTVGFVSGRDSLTIGFDPMQLWNRLYQFSRMNAELARQTFNLGKDSRDWKVENAQNDFKQSGSSKELLASVSYRPFDNRFTYYTGNSRGLFSSPQHSIMQHILKDNIGLAIGRQGQVVGLEQPWNLAFVTNEIIDFNLFYRGGELLFPLYLYKPSEPKKKSGFHGTMMLFEPEEEYDTLGRKPNIAPKVFAMLESAYRQMPTPEQILYYCYAVLYSPLYREKYAEFLKVDFPRIPFTSDYNLFLLMAGKGEELTQLHLLKSKKLNNPLTKYWGKGEDLIEKPVYDEKNQCVFINPAKHFDGITREVWEYHIGGYQVMEKYLKDRKGRQMTDPATYCKIASALAETLKIQKELSEGFERIEGGNIVYDTHQLARVSDACQKPPIG
jgi:predicted helicase